jgi:hypothetical protein
MKPPLLPPYDPHSSQSRCRTRKSLAGRRRIRFPEPIGTVDCVHTLHSEPVTLPAFLAGRGVRDVTWLLGLPPQLEAAVQAFASAGLGSTAPLAVEGGSIAPVDFLAACIDDQLTRAPSRQEPFSEHGCLRAEAWGLTGGAAVRVSVDCVLEAIAAVLLASGEASCPGAYGPESAIEPTTMFAQLAERGFRTSRTEQRALA